MLSSARILRSLSALHFYFILQKLFLSYLKPGSIPGRWARLLLGVDQQYPEVIHSPQHRPALSASRRSLSARYAQALRASGGPCGNGRMSTVRRAVSRCLGPEECGVDWVGNGATLAAYRQWYGACGTACSRVEG